MPRPKNLGMGEKLRGEVLIRKLEIEKEGVLRRNLDKHTWVDHEDISTRHDSDIARAAAHAGYSVGDTFKYKVVIEPKK